MFDATISDNSLDSSSLISNNFNLFKSDLFSNSTSPQQLSLNPNFNLDSSDRAVALSHNFWDSQMLFPQSQLENTAFSTADSTHTALASLTTETSSDPLTGMAVNNSLVGNTVQTSLSPQSASTSDSSLAAATASNVLRVVGNLRANRFTIPYAGYSYVLSGNGNVDFGSGYRDYIDLYGISYKTVGFNFASSTGGGVLYNPGNGVRLFDSMRLSNGTQILFEGIDSIRFSEGLVNLSVQPNDPGFNAQWNLHMMGVQNAWRFTRGSTGVLVGVQDTGLGVSSGGLINSDLRSTIIYPNNYRDDFTSSSSSHGTAVQGIIAAASNNGIGLSGINWNSSVYNIDVLGGNAYDQTLAQATQNMINFANSRGQKLVINMSLGGGYRDYVFEQLVANNRNNALFVIASGNENRSSLSYPAWLAYYYNNVISVGASWGTRDYYGSAKTPGDRISYPGWWGSNYGYGLTVMGPSEVLTTKATGSSGSAYAFGYEGRFNGTSAATPNVAGVASLVWSANGNLSAGQVRAILAQTAFDLGTGGYDYIYGYGLVNADAAVRQAMALVRIGSFSASASPTASALGGNPLASNTNTSLSANRFAANSVVATLSSDGSKSLEFVRDKIGSDRTYFASSIFKSLPAISDNAIARMTNTTQVVDLSKKSRLLGDGFDVYDPFDKTAIVNLNLVPAIA